MADPISGAGTAPVSGADKKKPINAVYEDKNSGVSVDDFLNLMVAQMQNQDPMNPMEDTQYVTQLAQFATMQQMQELAYYSRSNFVMSLVGKEVTVAQSKLDGVQSITGPVEKVSLVNNEYLIYVDGKSFNLNQIMEIHPPAGTGDGTDGGIVEDLGLTLVNTTKTSASLEWERPTVEKDPNRDRLRYSVYYSTNGDFDTVESVKKNGKLVGEADRLGIDKVTVEGLSEGATYYVNVIVKDIHGKESVYKKQVIVMPDTKPEEV